MQELDCSGLKCPLPALRTKRALKMLLNGEILCVITTDPMASIDIPFLCQSDGHRLVEVKHEQERHLFIIAKGSV
jgi:tRNA 2-thiouridine synthesizing protein A